MRLSLIYCFLIFGIRSFAQPEGSVLIKPRPSWVTSQSYVDLVKDTANTSGGYFSLLYDDQYNTIRKESFHHYSQKVLSEKGLENISTLSMVFDPSYETLTVHSIDIIRNGKKINQLALGKFKVLKRETSLERLVYDGNLTAIFNLHDVQVGDILDYSYSYHGSNPVYGNKISKLFYLNFSVPVGKVICNIITDSNRDFEIRKFNNAGEPHVERGKDQTVYEWSATDVPALLSEESTPGWFDPYDHVQISDFGSWADLSSWAHQLFKMESYPKGLLTRIPGIQKANQEESILSAIQFVQDEVRYLSFSEGIHGHTPHAPDLILRQRFGDCKDKSVLLASLLRELGIKSYPVLVNSSYGKSLPDYLPSPSLFDHCIVQFTLRDSVFWIDPTLTFQRGPLKELFFPRYYYGLVISKENKALSELPSRNNSRISTHEDFYLDSVGGGATFIVKTTYTNEEANSYREYFKENSLTEIETQFINFYATDYPEIEKNKSIKWIDDPQVNIFTIEENYKISSLWTYDSATRKHSVSVYPRSLAYYFTKPTTKIRRTPYAIRFPLDIDHRISMHMPETWNVDTRTKKIETNNFVYESNVLYSDKIIQLTYHFHTKKSYVEKTEIKEHVSKLDESLNDMSFDVTYTYPATKTAATKFNLPFALILSVVLFSSLFFYKFLYLYDPEPKPSPESHASIGGWLILPAIGICTSPFTMLYGIFQANFFNYSNWRILTDASYSAYNPALGSLILAELSLNSLFAIFSIFFAFMFFKRRSSVPALAICFYGFNLVYLILDAIIGSQFGNDLDSKEIQVIIRGCIGAIIWIPYFLTSYRSKGTFTVRLKIPTGHQEIYRIKYN